MSYRAECHEMKGTIAAFTEQHALQASRCSTLQCNPWAPSIEYSSLTVCVPCRNGTLCRRVSSLKQQGVPQESDMHREFVIDRVSSLYCHLMNCMCMHLCTRVDNPSVCKRVCVSVLVSVCMCVCVRVCVYATVD